MAAWQAGQDFAIITIAMQKNSPIKSKFGKPLGFRSSDHFKSKTFSEKNLAASGGFKVSAFKKTQHKG